jgi:nucleotide-binding universal stress UspA family protein
MYKRILIVVGSGASSRAAVNEGVGVAQVQGAEVVFAYVLPRYVMPVSEMPLLGAPSPDEFQREARADAERLLATATLAANKAGVHSLHAVAAGVDDAQCIVDIARKRRCDLIVVASAGRNALMRLLTGSVIPGLITISPVPVLVCRPSATRQAKRFSIAPRQPRRRKADTLPKPRSRLAA